MGKEGWIETNIGLMPIEDYLDIVACQSGFDSYEDMRAEGYHLSNEDELRAKGYNLH